MAYYNRNGEALNIGKRKMEYLSAGYCGTVSHDNEIILKEYFSNTWPDCRLSAEMFDRLKDINNDHFIELFEIYSNINKSKLEEDKVNNKKFIVDAYTAKYYSDDSVNVLYESIDYILDNFHELEKLFDIFTDNAILTNDIRRENTILGHSGIVIIDPDTFSISIMPKHRIAIWNKIKLLALFRSVLKSSMNDIENCDDGLMNIFFNLGAVDVDSKTDVTYELSKELKHVKWPREYLKKIDKEN